MKKKKVVAVASGKGGVGKSTLAFTLAKTLVKKGVRVGLLDADLYGPSLHLLFLKQNLEPPLAQEGYFLPSIAEGISFMSGAFFAPGGAFVRAPKATGLINSFFNQVDWGDVEILIVDFPPGTGDIPLTLMQEHVFDGVLLITTPHTLSVEDTAKSALLFKKAQIPILSVVENMAYLEIDSKKIYPFGKGGGQELAELLQRSDYVQIPLIDTSSLQDSLMQALEPFLKPIAEHLINQIFDFEASCVR